MIIHRCLSCNENRQMTRVVIKLYKNGRPALSGYCKECGAKMNRFLPKFPPMDGVTDDSD